MHATCKCMCGIEQNKPNQKTRAGLPVDEVYGLCFELFRTMQVCQNEDVCHVLDRQTVTQSLFAHHLQSLQSILQNQRELQITCQAMTHAVHKILSISNSFTVRPASPCLLQLTDDQPFSPGSELCLCR